MGAWDYPPGGGVEVDRKEEGGIKPPEGLEECVRAGDENFLWRSKKIVMTLLKKYDAWRETAITREQKVNKLWRFAQLC